MVTLAEYVEMGIRDVFLECAEAINIGEIEMTEDEAAGVPLLLLRAQGAMVIAWAEWLRKERQR